MNPVMPHIQGPAFRWISWPQPTAPVLHKMALSRIAGASSTVGYMGVGSGQFKEGLDEIHAHQQLFVGVPQRRVIACQITLGEYCSRRNHQPYAQCLQGHAEEH